MHNEKLVVFIGGALQAEFKMVPEDSTQIIYALEQELFFYSSDKSKYDLSYFESSEIYFQSRHQLKTFDKVPVAIFHTGQTDLEDSVSLSFVRTLISCMPLAEILQIHDIDQPIID